MIIYQANVISEGMLWCSFRRKCAFSRIQPVHSSSMFRYLLSIGYFHWEWIFRHTRSVTSSIGRAFPRLAEMVQSLHCPYFILSSFSFHFISHFWWLFTFHPLLDCDCGCGAVFVIERLRLSMLLWTGTQYRATSPRRRSVVMQSVLSMYMVTSPGNSRRSGLVDLVDRIATVW